VGWRAGSAADAKRMAALAETKALIWALRPGALRRYGLGPLNQLGEPALTTTARRWSECHAKRGQPCTNPCISDQGPQRRPLRSRRRVRKAAT
jgi:hypothetical protein